MFLSRIQPLETCFPALKTEAWRRYREELTFREIGHRLGIPENTAKTYFQRVRPLLRTALASLEAEGFRMEQRVARPSTTTKRGSER